MHATPALFRRLTSCGLTLSSSILALYSRLEPPPESTRRPSVHETFGSFGSRGSPGCRATGAWPPKHLARLCQANRCGARGHPRCRRTPGRQTTSQVTVRLPRALWYALNPCIFQRVVSPRHLQVRCSAAFPPAPNSRVPPLTGRLRSYLLRPLSSRLPFWRRASPRSQPRRCA